MSLLLTLIFFSFTFGNEPSEARSTAKKKLPSAVVGTVYCDTCLQNDYSKTGHFISGALVAVECNDANSETSFYEEVQTDEHGKFMVQLPFLVNKHVKKIQGCSVKSVTSNDPLCTVAAFTTSSSLELKSRSPGTQMFSAGLFAFKPLTKPNLCKQKPSIQTSKNQNSAKSANADPAFPASFPDFAGPFSPIPRLPSLPPLPQLPPLPSLPGLPFFQPLPPNTTPSTDPSKGSDQVSNQKTFGIPPNPFNPPVTPNPLQRPPAVNPLPVPSPPFSLLPTPTFPPVVTAPLTPPPSAFPFFPPFPFEPVPGFPKNPRTPFSSLSKKTNP